MAPGTFIQSNTLTSRIYIYMYLSKVQKKNTIGKKEKKKQVYYNKTESIDAANSILNR